MSENTENVTSASDLGGSAASPLPSPGVELVEFGSSFARPPQWSLLGNSGERSAFAETSADIAGGVDGTLGIFDGFGPSASLQGGVTIKPGAISVKGCFGFGVGFGEEVGVEIGGSASRGGEEGLRIDVSGQLDIRAVTGGVLGSVDLNSGNFAGGGSVELLKVHKWEVKGDKEGQFELSSKTTGLKPETAHHVGGSVFIRLIYCRSAEFWHQ